MLVDQEENSFSVDSSFRANTFSFSACMTFTAFVEAEARMTDLLTHARTFIVRGLMTVWEVPAGARVD